MLIILLNMTTMAIEHYDMSEGLENALYWINQLFVFIFTCECVMKLLGLRQYYFKQPWNVFDFVVVISSVLSKQRLKIIIKLCDLKFHSATAIEYIYQWTCVKWRIFVGCCPWLPSVVCLSADQFTLLPKLVQFISTKTCYNVCQIFETWTSLKTLQLLTFYCNLY